MEAKETPLATLNPPSAWVHGNGEEFIDAPDWEVGGRVHNWRNHVGERTKAIWATLTTDQRLAVMLDADDAATNEHWD